VQQGRDHGKNIQPIDNTEFYQLARLLLKRAGKTGDAPERKKTITTHHCHEDTTMKKTLNFFDRLMIAVTFAEAGIDAADCTPARPPHTARPNSVRSQEQLPRTARARG
jgi:hypothetical protein